MITMTRCMLVLMVPMLVGCAHTLPTELPIEQTETSHKACQAQEYWLQFKDEGCK